MHEAGVNGFTGTDMRSGFLFHQEDLHALCKGRTLVTSEIHEPNDFYGQAVILKKYAGFPEPYPLRAVLEHGLFFDDWMWDVDRSARLPLYFSVSPLRARIHERETGRTSIPIGFGYLYAMATFRTTDGTGEERVIPRGTIVFPSHSTHHVKAAYDHEAYAKTLDALPPRYKPLTVCIYWKDYHHGYHLPYERKGFRIVTAGHIYDPDFLYRFHDICRRFKYSTSNNIGGHLFYSVKSGCSFFYTPSEDITHEARPGVHVGGFTSMYRMIKETTFSLFSEPKDAMNGEQLEFIDEYLGTSHVKSREELGDLFRFAEQRDRAWNISANPSGAKPSLLRALPTYWQRKLLCLPSRVMRGGRRLRQSPTDIG